jgi:CheY-specific phosphatase CheX
LLHHPLLSTTITDVTVDLFAKMFGVQVQFGESRHEQVRARTESGVAAVVTMSGRYIGTGTIVCSGDSACKLATLFLGETYPYVNDDVLDGVAEIANMIIGNIKNVLDERIGPLYLGTPTVIHGRNFSTRNFSPSGWTIVPVKVGEAEFVVQATLAINTVANGDAKKPLNVGLGIQR